MHISSLKLVDARLARAMSQEELAMACALSARTIQRIEAGHSASLESTKALLAVLGVDILDDPAPTDPQYPLLPWRQLGRQIAGRFRLVASLGFDGLRLVCAAALLVVAAAKLVVPGQAGWFVAPGRQVVGLVASPPPGAREVLGYGLIPVMLAAAMLMLLSMARVRAGVRDRTVRRR